MSANDHRESPVRHREHDHGSGAVDFRDARAEEVLEPHRLLGVLADTAKLRVFAALVLAPEAGVAASEVAETAALGAAETERALANLTAVGLARRTPAGYAAHPAILRTSLSELAKRREEEAAKQFATEDPAKLSVLLHFFRDGRLVQMPEKYEKQRIVLEEIAQHFEPGTRYAEAEVNMMLQAVYTDYAALRRYLVDSALLSRGEGYYWRSGGTVAV